MAAYQVLKSILYLDVVHIIVSSKLNNWFISRNVGQII